MLKWLRTLPDHTYNDERMEEIHSKADENSVKQDTSTDTDNITLSENPCCPGESSDTKPITEGGKSDKNEQVETSQDVSAEL